MPSRLLTVLLLLLTADAIASDAYIARFNVSLVYPDCFQLTWHDSVALYNTTDAPLTVTILGTSDGIPAVTDPSAVTLPPHEVVDLDRALHGAWLPRPDQYLSFLHLDIPAGVASTASDEFFVDYACIPLPVEGAPGMQ